MTSSEDRVNPQSVGWFFMMAAMAIMEAGLIMKLLRDGASLPEAFLAITIGALLSGMATGCVVERARLRAYAHMHQATVAVLREVESSQNGVLPENDKRGHS